MSKNVKSKILFIIFVMFLIITIFNIKVNAETGKFTIEKESIDVKLNKGEELPYSGGDGTVTWQSEDTSIATAEHGWVEGKKIGTTNIKATSGGETATCKVNVVYGGITIGGNQGESITKVNLILGVHDTENLVAKVKDGISREVSDAVVTWTSSDPNTVTVDKTTGTIKAVKQGEATITASAAGVTGTCKVTVNECPQFTDFSKAQFETISQWISERLQIKGVQIGSESTHYYYVITSDNKKPDIPINDFGKVDNTVEEFSINKGENYIYCTGIEKYAELNQDMYIWILQSINLGDGFYYNTNGEVINYATKFVVEGKKIEKAKLPQLNLILQSALLGDDSVKLDFNFPTDTEKRKFTLKIGKVTDNSILSKIQKNDYEGITELLSYAKSHDSVYSQNFTTTNKGEYVNKKLNINEKNILQDGAYYYIYVEFDDENGKYCPVEGITLGQAAIFDDWWGMATFTDDDFKWNNVTDNPVNTEKKTETESKKEDNTTSAKKLPKTGVTSIALVSLIGMILLGIFFYKKYNKFKSIK